MSAATPSGNGKALIDRLPENKRSELIGIGREALRRFGYRYQQVFDDHLQVFDFLAEQGATAIMIGQMLAEVGVARKDGSPLPAGTVTSALSRARERAPQHSSAPRHVPARSGMNMPVTASTGTALRSPAPRCTDACSPTPEPRPTAPQLPPRPQSFSGIRPSPNAQASTQMPATTSRAAARLEQLRSRDDEQ